MHRFEHITHWALDMDGMLYDSEPYVIPKFYEGLESYIEKHVPDLQGQDIYDTFFKYADKFGVFCKGFVENHGVDADHILKHVHDFDISPVPVCKETAQCVSELPGQRIIFTDAPREFAHRMTTHLGISPHLHGIFGVEDGGYHGKKGPDAKIAFQKFLDKYEVEPDKVCLIEDSHKNLIIAHELGMTTVLVPRHKESPQAEYIHHTAPTFKDWKKSLTPIVTVAAPTVNTLISKNSARICGRVSLKGRGS